MTGRITRSRAFKVKTEQATPVQSNVLGSDHRLEKITSANGFLLSFPPEILQMILSNIHHSSTISKLGRSCKDLYAIMTPLLYHRVIIAAPFHAHIAKLIRTLEPLLTISQKKQLKKEGKYKGQQDRYSSKLDENTIPTCINYVRQFVIGRCDPGKKHQYIVDRYLEEAFKNMKNLEIVQTEVLTTAIGENLALNTSLIALRLLPFKFEANATKPLAQLRNLQHLSLDGGNWHGNPINGNAIQSILLNSMSTLKTLSITSNVELASYFKDWEQKASAGQEALVQDHDFTALRALTLANLSFDAPSTKSLSKAVNFLGLQDLSLGSMSRGDCRLYQYLANLFATSKGGAANTSLKKLHLNLSEGGYFYGEDFASLQSAFKAKCAFISSFDTLTTLTLEDYNQYPNTIAVNPGLPDLLIDAIIKHRDLRTLKIFYRGIRSGRKIPYPSARVIARLVDNLPCLQELEFAPDKREIHELGLALSQGRNLTSITCYPCYGTNTYPEPDNSDQIILHGFLNSFLSSSSSKTDKRFVWEERFSLTRISTLTRDWDVASKFEVSKRRAKKSVKLDELRAPQTITTSDGKRAVSYRIVERSPKSSINGVDPYHPSCDWVNMAADDIF